MPSSMDVRSEGHLNTKTYQSVLQQWEDMCMAKIHFSIGLEPHTYILIQCEMEQDATEFHTRMLGTFNQHLPMILSNNYWDQSKPTSLHDMPSYDCVK